jgi:hypothetical protein
MKQKILILIFLVELFAIFQWLKCTNLLALFHYSAYDLQLRLIENIHNDQLAPLWEVRVFHNKLIGSFFDLIKNYIQFWDFSFLVSLISLAGVGGLGANFYYFFTTKKKTRGMWFLFFCVILSPFLEILQFHAIPFFLRLVFIVLPFIIWSLLGYWQLFKSHKVKTWVILLILILSVWYQVVAMPFISFCLS